MSATEPLPDWLRRRGGYTADDLDTLPELPPHTELVDGSLVFVSLLWADRCAPRRLQLTVPFEIDIDLTEVGRL